MPKKQKKAPEILPDNDDENDGEEMTFIKAAEKVNEGKSPIESQRGGSHTGTWVHPIVAIHLAEWLSPEFSVYVKQTFVRFLEGDITLADEILQRATKEDAEWLRDRAEGKLARLEFTDELKRRGVNKIGFANNTNAIYKGMFGDTAAGLKESLGVKNPRDGMSKTELRALAFAESLATDIMDKRQAYGNTQTTKCSSIAGNHVGNALEQALDNLLRL